MNNYFDNFYDWWKNIDKYIFSLVFILFFLGLFFSLASTSLIASDKLDTNSYYFFVKHFIFIILAITILMIFSFFGAKNMKNVMRTDDFSACQLPNSGKRNAYW